MNEEKRHAYLIVAHNNLNQLNKLIELLDHQRNDLFIHLDKKSSISLDDIREFKNGGITKKYKEIEVFWSDVSLAEVELFLLSKAVSENKEYEFLHMISGVDLPLKKQDEILAFYDENSGKEFIEYQIDGKFISKPYRERIKYYHFFSKHWRGKNKLLNNIFVGLEYFLIFFQWLFRVNRLKKGEEWARGSNWFDITSSLASDLVENRDELLKRYKRTRAADESFVPLFVHNSKYRNNLYLKTFDGDMRANMRYIDWERGDPYTWREDDHDTLMSSGMLFARKFDENIDSKIIDKIYTELK